MKVFELIRQHDDLTHSMGELMQGLIFLGHDPGRLENARKDKRASVRVLIEEYDKLDKARKYLKNLDVTCQVDSEPFLKV